MLSAKVLLTNTVPSDMPGQETFWCVQLHAWVTAMSLKNKLLDTWPTKDKHPGSAPSTPASAGSKRSRQPSPKDSQHKAGKTGPNLPQTKPRGSSAPSHKHSAVLALHADASSTGSASSCQMDDKLSMAAAYFNVHDVSGVVASGSTGPVYCARYGLP